MAQVKTLIRYGEKSGAVIYAKTGWVGRQEPQTGWWVGWVEKKGRPVAYFAMNLDPTSRTVFPDRFAITRAILHEAGFLPAL